MKKILILLLSIYGYIGAQTQLDPAIASAINSQCCGATSSSSIIYVDSVSSNTIGDSLIVYKNGTRFAYKYPSGSVYTLPIATTSILGGVKDGSGVYIAPDGTISAERQTFAQNGSNFIVTTYDTANGVTPQTFTWTAPDFWRKSVSIPVLANTLPNGVNDTNTYIQHVSDIFVGATGLVRVGNGGGGIVNNTVVGNGALSATTTGTYTTAIGFDVLKNQTSGVNNTGVGAFSLSFNTTGVNNSALGYGALYLNTNGTYNSSFGAFSLFNNTTGGTNTAVGARALFNNTTANGNTGVGYAALGNNTIGGSNTAIGQFALSANTTGSNNSAIGDGSLTANTTGSFNVGIGKNSGQSMTTATENIFIGYYSGAGITTGSENITMGSGGNSPLRGVASATSAKNVVIGGATARELNGVGNVGMGYGSIDIGVGSFNTILGSYAFGPSTGSGWAIPSNITTSGNTFVGSKHNYSSLAQLAIGDNNTALGFNINQRVVGLTNSTAIGANATNDASNQVQIGDVNVNQVRTYGAVVFQKTYASGSVPNNSMYVDSTDGKLYFKDSTGVSNPLY